MPRELHSLGITDELWRILQELSGLTNPAPYGRELLQKAAYAELEARKFQGQLKSKIRSPEPDPEPVVDPRRQEFDARWLEVDCDVDWDDDLRVARAWFIERQRAHTPQDREEMALRFIERAVERGSMKSPRGWLIKKYQQRDDGQQRPA